MAILLFARDPGPANHIVAVYELLTGETPRNIFPRAQDFITECRPHLPGRVYAKGTAIEVFHRADIACTELSSSISLHELIEREQISLLVTGTSDVDDDTDRLLWKTAKEKNIPSHAFIDHPSSLGIRFRMKDGTPSLPDRIHVPDQDYVGMLIAEGIPESRIDVTGPIHAQRLKRLSAKLGTGTALRAEWGAQPDDFVVLFASECAMEMASEGRPSPYNELEVLDQLTRQMIAGDTFAGKRIDPERSVLVVRPHPRDKAGKYDAWLRQADAKLRRAVSNAGSPENAVLSADLVAGMDSSLLRDAIALSRAAISLTGADLRL